LLLEILSAFLGIFDAFIREASCADISWPDAEVEALKRASKDRPLVDPTHGGFNHWI